MSNINTITNAGGNQVSEEQFTDFAKILLMVRNPKLCFSKYGRKESFQKGQYTKDVRRFNKFSVSSTPTSLIEGQTPSAKVFTVTNFTLTPSQYGGFSYITDRLQNQGFDDSVVELVSRFGEYIAETENIVTRNDIVGNLTVQYANGKTALTDLDNSCKVTLTEIKKSVRTLRSANVDGNSGMLYQAIMHPDNEFDIQEDSDFQDLAIRNDGGKRIDNYTLGTLAGCEIVVTTETYVALGTGATTSSTNNDGINVTGTQADVYYIHVIGKEAYVTADCSGIGGSTKVYVKRAENSGTEDPLEQRHSVGAKVLAASKVVDSLGGIEIRCTASS